MAKIFIDTEFIEGFNDPLIGKKRHFIDLISIALKNEDGTEYYAVSNEFNPKDADDWVRENVISKLYDEDGMKLHPECWKSNKEIAEDIQLFLGRESIDNGLGNAYFNYPDNPEFYAYYADYDWVLFCSLFGRMINLPDGWPMYCRDLKQIFDEKVLTLCSKDFHESDTRWNNKKHFDHVLKTIKESPEYPLQEAEHNALDDARWNLRFYNFLQNIK